MLAANWGVGVEGMGVYPKIFFPGRRADFKSVKIFGIGLLEKKLWPEEVWEGEEFWAGGGAESESKISLAQYKIKRQC